MYTCGLTVVIKRIRYVMFTGNGSRESVQCAAQSSRVQMKLGYGAARFPGHATISRAPFVMTASIARPRDGCNCGHIVSADAAVRGEIR